MNPTDRRYSKDHEWLQVEDGKGRLGITDFAQNELGDIVYVELPEVGKRVARGDVIGTIESVKAVSEIYAPVAGEVVEANAALDASPEKVNGEPFGDGWYCVLKLDDPSEADALMDAAAYEELISG